jgi:hypothetical protein
MFFGKLFFAVAAFLNNSNEVGSPALSGIIRSIPTIYATFDIAIYSVK